MGCFLTLLLRTRVVSVGEFDAVDVQRHSEVDRPPRIYLFRVCTHARSVGEVRAVVAVVGVGGMINAPCIAVDTGLMGRTI